MIVTLLIWFAIVALLALLYVGAMHWLLTLFFGGAAFLVVGLVGTALTESEDCAIRRYLPMVGLGFIFMVVSVAIGTAMTLTG
jgi:O-antigen ligase